MQITETSVTPEIYRQWLAPRDVPPRSAGIHVSDVLREMLVSIGRYDADKGTPNETMWDLGNAWEDVLSQALASRMHGNAFETRLPKVELERDGIYGSPDDVIIAESAIVTAGAPGAGVLVEAGEIFIEETKATWMSANHSITSMKLLPYVLQVKTYCCMADCRVGRIRAFFINGHYDYKTKGPNPVPKEWYIRFSDRDLSDWWTSFTRQAARLRKEQDERHE